MPVVSIKTSTEYPKHQYFKVQRQLGLGLKKIRWPRSWFDSQNTDPLSNETIEFPLVYENVTYPRKGTLIVAFTDITYLPVTKIWYEQIRLSYGTDS